MRNRFNLQRAFLIMLLLTGFAAAGMAQDTKVIGKLVKNVATVTDLATAERVLLQGLTLGSSATNIRILGPDEQGKYYLAGDILLNDKVNGRGFQLSRSGNDITINRGPGVEIECTGRNCNRCILQFSKWRPWCKCDNDGFEQASDSDEACDMTSKYIVTTF